MFILALHLPPFKIILSIFEIYGNINLLPWLFIENLFLRLSSNFTEILHVLSKIILQKNLLLQ